MKKSFAASAIVFLLTALLFLGLSVQPARTAYADTGPKPSVCITFENMSDELCYGTLLSEEPSTGPASVWNGEEDDIYLDGLDYDVWKAFVDFQDEDGFYFLQIGWLCSESKQLNWTYYPPNTFKILLYYPDTQSFAVSEIYSRYTFHSYYSVNMAGFSVGNGDVQTLPQAEQIHHNFWEVFSFICRVVITIGLETGMALLFGLRKRKQLLVVLVTNVVTQILLNIFLSVMAYSFLTPLLIAFYAMLEVLVVVIEAIVYSVAFRIQKEKVPVWKSILYAVCANIVSFGVGLLLAYIIPGIF